ncbi:MAG TPA: helicase-related protein [Anaerolineae bacterium]|nr:helicase-related protein [Anaerolineae bacterium]HQH37454.1 helicase-related protein [Anaerolineae bacterium]
MSLLTEYNFHLSYGPGDDRLHAFYIPALAASVRYDRMTGYFSSYALAISAAGVAHLIANGGRMRLLVGAQLSREDVEAIEAGYNLHDVVAERLGPGLPDPETLTDQLLRARLEALAWLVAHERLDIRVVLPKGPGGLPLPAPASREYFHAKVGVFTDAAGHQVVFDGSINESETGWEHNYEQFMVFCSWNEGQLWVTEAMARFERLWQHREPDWISLPVPEAARQSLLRYAPYTAPTHDPLERPDHLKRPSRLQEQTPQILFASALEHERWTGQFLRDAPHLINGAGLGAATAPVAPWPHQLAVARQIVETYPSRYLLGDEVGLGKTIEAGLVLRELWLRGLVKRAVILAPKSVLRQWQEELYEKFALNVPQYNGKDFVDYGGQLQPAATPNPWDSVSLALASSQLLKRQDRQAELLTAAPWDLVLVDEAHHARRKDFLDQRTYRPNRLLELLRGLQARTQSLLLMTATPMQVDPIEVWDLLELLGLSGEWGGDERNFLRFYTELRSQKPDWDFIFRMVQAERETAGDSAGSGIPAAWVHQAQQRLGAVGWAQLQQILEASPPTAAAAFKKLPPATQALTAELLRRTTPLQRLVFRNTRPLLRDYVRRGLLRENVPYREPCLIWIDMRAEERELYLRLEEYISNFYRRYEARRTGLGFVMTVYRRRLTSSFYAVQCSLQRRLAFLRGQADLLWDDDDLEQDALAFDVDEEAELTAARHADDAAEYQEEIAYVEDFLCALQALSSYDSKVEQLQRDLETVFRQRETALVFTQYTDTLDFLREQLRQQYGSQVACYSGRGGEWWDGNAWMPITKEELKNAFREGERIKILLATEAASEGLNLQTCGVLINYDMPWNPMRVEQRIGRVDRIGQRYERVWIYNYFYQGTVEAKVYQALNCRLDWFQNVVGPLQPILAQVGRAIQHIALTGNAERQRVLQRELADLDAALDRQETQLNLDEEAAQPEVDTAWSAPFSLEEMAAAILATPTLQTHFRPHETVNGAYWLDLEGEHIAVTFDRQVFDNHPNTVQLLTFGNPRLDVLLQTLPDAEGDATPEDQPSTVLRVATAAPLPRVGYFTQDRVGGLQPVNSLAGLHQALKAADRFTWTTDQIAAAQTAVQSAAEAEWTRVRQGQERLQHIQREALLARAGRLVLDAALVELALGQQPGLLDQAGYPLAFDATAISGLRRHGYPWAPLLKIAGAHLTGRKPHPTDPFFTQIQGESPEQLKRRFKRLTDQAAYLLKALASLSNESGTRQ